MTLLVGSLVIALAAVAVLRRVDVRLVLIVTGLTLAALAGHPAAVVRRFLLTFAEEKFVVPICSAMGFAYVLRQTQCDQHLVHLLVRPVRRMRVILLPATVLIGFTVNIPIISQTSTAVIISSVLLPLLLAARFSPPTVGAALLLGSSVGGELLNPGAPELRTVVQEIGKAAARADAGVTAVIGTDCVARVVPLNLVQLAVATLAFWLLNRGDRAGPDRLPEGGGAVAGAAASPEFRVNLLRALVPLLPLVLLFLTARPFELLRVPPEWLLEDPGNKAELPHYDSRLIGLAMMIGVGVATLTAPRSVWGTAGAFFEGAGFAFTHIISLIAAADCFGEGVKQLGLARLLGDLIKTHPELLLPAAAALPLGFGTLSGSGMAATNSLYGFFVEPAIHLETDPAHVGAVVSLAAAAGRTLSPVAAVTLMCATLTRTSPMELSRRVAGPLLLGVLAMLLTAWLTAGPPQPVSGGSGAAPGGGTPLPARM